MSEFNDIALDVWYQLQSSANGDFLLLQDARMQDICMEAISPQGDLFYYPGYGWGLIEFAQRPLNALLELEIAQRVRGKLSERENVSTSSVHVSAESSKDGLHITIAFRFLGETELQQLGLLVTPLEIEVIQLD